MNLETHFRETVWPRRGAVGRAEAAALRPLSALFGLGVGLRGLGYRLGLLPSRRAPIPVVSVGNLVVGGAGKTPVTLWLAEGLRARGANPAIVSRGYGGTASGVTIVSRGGGAEVGPDVAGDEPAMLAKSFAGAVVVAARRLDGVLAAAEMGCDVAVLDDGFQHRAIARDFDLVVLDGRCGALLPAGPFREPPRAAGRADAVLLMAKDADEAVAPPPGLRVAAYRASLEAGAVVESVAGIWHAHPMGRLAGRRVIAVTGIARPEPFYALLQRWDTTIDEVFEYPDHHRYTAEQWQRIARRSHDVDLVVTTEKDLVKLEAFPFATGKLVALRIAPDVQGGAALLDDVAARVGLPARRPTEENPDGDQ